MLRDCTNEQPLGVRVCLILCDLTFIVPLLLIFFELYFNRVSVALVTFPNTISLQYNVMTYGDPVTMTLTVDLLALQFSRT